MKGPVVSQAKSLDVSFLRDKWFMILSIGGAITFIS
jgi:hypothetical protein